MQSTDRKRQRRTGWSAALLLAVSGLLVGVVPAAHATGHAGTVSPLIGGCDTSKGKNPQDGFVKDSSRGQAKGARSSILVQGSEPCTTSDNFTTAWVMVYAPAGDTGWSQVGYRKNASTEITEQWSQTYSPDYNNGYPVDVYGNHALAGYTHHYTTELGTCQPRTYPACLENYIDGTLFSDTAWSPDREWGATSAWSVAYMEESYYYGSNIPGTPSNPVVFGQTARLNYMDSNLAWHDADCAFLGPPYNSDPTHWGQEPQSSNCDLQWVYTSNPY